MQKDIPGESVTLTRRGGYTIHYIKPCTMERGKVMAKVKLAHPAKDMFERLAKAGFDDLKAFPDLGIANLRFRGMHIIVFSSGEISIRTARSREDIFEAAELLAKLLAS